MAVRVRKQGEHFVSIDADDERDVAFVFDVLGITGMHAVTLCKAATLGRLYWADETLAVPISQHLQLSTARINRDSPWFYTVSGFYSESEWLQAARKVERALTGYGKWLREGKHNGSKN